MNTLAEFKRELQENSNVKWNQGTTLESLWTYEVKGAIDQIWNYISDTSRFNREVGLAPREQKEVDGKVVVTTTMLGIPQQWIEEPWMWVSGRTITAERKYIYGMARGVQAVFHLEVLPQGGTKIYIYFGWNPKNYFWAKFLKLTEGLIKNKFRMVFEKVDSYLIANKNAPGVAAFRRTNSGFDLDQKRRLYGLSEKLIANGIDKNLVNKLVEFIESGDELDLDAIRVIQLAHNWGVNYKDLLKVCLHSSRMGMLNISWNVVCPHCRGPRMTAAHLGEIPTAAKCEACEVEFSTDDKSAVEVVFKVHPSIRKLSDAVYCAAEPAKKNHIKIQQLITPKSKVSLVAPQIEGLYKARLKGRNDEILFRIDPKSNVGEFKLDFSRAENTPTPIAVNSKLLVENTSDEALVVSVEQLQKNDQALRPGHLLFFPEFRDLFSEEHLQSDVKLHLGEHALLFTDIVGSTVFYDKVGDAKAFADVRKHFIDVFSEVKAHNGDVVKTIGDAVMAAFPTIREAYDATVAIQKKFHPNRTDINIRLRASVHYGVVIGVHLDTGIDYFGSTINKCAKIQGLAGAGEVVMTDKVFEELHLENKGLPTRQQVYGAGTDRPMPVKIVTIS